MNFDEHCRGDGVPVSFIAAAPADAGFAALLTGFMISAIAFLLGRERREDKILHAVALFAPGLLVLALACNQFVGISASAPPKVGEHIEENTAKACSIGWTQGTTANGMLGVGFVVAVAGLVWMMAHAVDGNSSGDAQENGAQDRRTLIHLGNFLVFVAIATVSLLLTRGSLGYYDMMGGLGVPPPKHLKGVVWGIFWSSMAVDARIIYVRTAGYYRVRRERIDGKWDGRDESTAARVLRRGSVICVVVLTAGLALVGPLHASLASHNSVPGGVAAFFAVVLGALFPLGIFFFISASVPGPDFWYWDVILDSKAATKRPPPNKEVDGQGAPADPRELIDAPPTAAANGRTAPG
jgi:hypothetical protein